MNPQLSKALSAPEVEDVLARALAHAESRLRWYRWRGQSATVSSKKAMAGSGLTGEDFVSIALERLMSGRRAYKAGISLLDNLKRSINSIIWSHFKHAENQTLFDVKEDPDSDTDPILESPDTTETPAEKVDSEELAKQRADLYAEIKSNVKDDPELVDILTAMEMGVTKAGEIANFLSWPVEKIYEGNRRLQKRGRKFTLDYKKTKE